MAPGQMLRPRAPQVGRDLHMDRDLLYRGLAEFARGRARHQAAAEACGSAVGLDRPRPAAWGVLARFTGAFGSGSAPSPSRLVKPSACSFSAAAAMASSLSGAGSLRFTGAVPASGSPRALISVAASAMSSSVAFWP